MKNFFNDILDKDTLFIIFIALLTGLFIGVFFQSGFSSGIKMFFRNVYIKINPDAKKNSKTLIIERATKDCYVLPQNIFEKPHKKENRLIYIIKQLKPKTEKPKTINDNNF